MTLCDTCLNKYNHCCSKLCDDISSKSGELRYIPFNNLSSTNTDC